MTLTLTKRDYEICRDALRGLTPWTRRSKSEQIRATLLKIERRFERLERPHKPLYPMSVTKRPKDKPWHPSK